jgi:hypothetical protein
MAPAGAVLAGSASGPLNGGGTPPMAIPAAMTVAGRRLSMGTFLRDGMFGGRTVVCRPVGWAGPATTSGYAAGGRGAAAGPGRPSGGRGQRLRWRYRGRGGCRGRMGDRGAGAGVTGAWVTFGAGAGVTAAWVSFGAGPGPPGPAGWCVNACFPAAGGAAAACREPAKRAYTPKPSTSTSPSTTTRFSQRPGAGRPAPPLVRRGRTRPVERVILGDQRPGIGPDGLGDAADVRPGVKVATAGRVVAALDRRDERFPDAGLLTDLGNGQARPLARFGQGFTDRHAAPPQLCRTAYPLP